MPAYPPQSLCLIRLSALGDVCHTVALVRALQAAWPETALTWIIGKKEAPLVKHLPNIRFIVFDKSDNLRSFGKIKHQLKSECFDVLVLAQTSVRANLLSLAVRAKRRVGFGGSQAKEGHALFINEPVDVPEKIHQAEAIFAFAPYLLQQPELGLSDIDRALPLDPKAMAFASTHQPQSAHAVLISPCSSHSKRNWSAKAYATVADWVIEKANRPVILMGGPSEKEQQMGQAIEANMRHRALNLIGQDTLDQALAMLSRGCCLISPDSGPAHMADGLGTPVVGLYAATRVARSGPWASQHHSIDAFAKAAQAFRGRQADRLPWGCRIEVDGVMDLITPDEVINRLQDLL